MTQATTTRHGETHGRVRRAELPRPTPPRPAVACRPPHGDNPRMSSTGSPDFEIAALRKKQEAVWDPLAHGPGTPWEDRGTHGTVGAFFKTCVASLTGPRRLADSIRRPETTTDARGFVIGCGILWGLSAAGHVGWALWHKAHSPPPVGYDLDEVNTLWVVIDLVVPLVGGTVGVVMLWMLYTAVYNRLIQQEARTVRLTEPLIANVAAYAFGPALLALIPVVGPPLAIVAMLVVMIVIGTSSRLRLRAAAAIIDALLGFLAIVAIAVAGCAIVSYASDRIVTSGVPLVEHVKNEANEPAIRPSR